MLPTPARSTGTFGFCAPLLQAFHPDLYLVGICNFNGKTLLRAILMVQAILDDNKAAAQITARLALIWCLHNMAKWKSLSCHLLQIIRTGCLTNKGKLLLLANESPCCYIPR
jgi:hypothetical protein